MHRFVHRLRRNHALRRDHRIDALRSRRSSHGRIPPSWLRGNHVRTGDNAERSREGTRGFGCRFDREGESVAGSRWQKSSGAGEEEPVEVLVDAVNLGIVKPRVGSMRWETRRARYEKMVVESRRSGGF
jgi:hypothetical protein